jgi:signal transduction histidine kinase
VAVFALLVVLAARTGGMAILAVALLAAALALAGAVGSARAELRAGAERRAWALSEEQRLRGSRLEAMGELGGVLAHDVNNLMVVVLEIAAALRERHPAAAELDELQEAARRGALLCRQFLGLVRRDQEPPALVDLRRVADEVAPLLRRLLSTRVVLSVSGSADRALARAEAAALELALLNLVANARDALPGAGAVAILADLVEVGPDHALFRAGARPGRYARLSVRDDGQGMDAATLSRAGEPFFTTKPPGRGTGLGLSSVKSTAAACGGQLVIESAPGRGTTVSILLPPAEGPGGGAIPP